MRLSLGTYPKDDYRWAFFVDRIVEKLYGMIRDCFANDQSMAIEWPLNGH